MRRFIDGLSNASRRLAELAQGIAREARAVLQQGQHALRARLRLVAERGGYRVALGRAVDRLRAQAWFAPALAAVLIVYVARLELRLAAIGTNVGDGGKLAVRSAEAAERSELALELARAADQRSRELRLGSEKVTLAAERARELAIDAAVDVDAATARAAAAERAAVGAERKASDAERLAALALEDVGGAEQRSRRAQSQAYDADVQARAALFAAVPAGTIVAWDPHLRDPFGKPRGMRELPDGWAICDGRAGTPNLVNRFLRGAADSDGAARYAGPSKMGPAGAHSHAADPMVNSYQWFRQELQGARKSRGEGLMLLDKGLGSDARSHGEHVHDDENVPAHFTVLFIVKLGVEPAVELEAPATPISARSGSFRSED